MVVDELDRHGLTDWLAVHEHRCLLAVEARLDGEHRLFLLDEEMINQTAAAIAACLDGHRHRPGRRWRGLSHPGADARLGAGRARDTERGDGNEAPRETASCTDRHRDLLVKMTLLTPAQLSSKLLRIGRSRRFVLGMIRSAPPRLARMLLRRLRARVADN